jgi:hypothetical protein
MSQDSGVDAVARRCHCGKPLPKRSDRYGFYPECNTCRSRDYAARNPLRIVWLNIKKSAKRRGKEFSLTYERVVELATEAGYVLGNNRHANGLSFDRIKTGIGYTDSNMRVLTLSENSAREYRDEWEPAETSPENVEIDQDPF